MPGLRGMNAPSRAGKVEAWCLTPISTSGDLVQTGEMGPDRSKFAGGDQGYLRDEQYSDSSRLEKRASLHALYGVSPVSWFDWVASHFALEPGQRVLEAGCGAGWLWEETAVPVPDDVSIELTDLSPGMVDTAVERVRMTSRFESVGGQPADLQALPYESVSFDRVVANHMLYHLPDPGLGVLELARVVKPDGIVIAATNGRRHMQELGRIRGDVFGMTHTDRTIDVFGADSGFAILRRNFDEVCWVGFRDELCCTNPSDVVAYICSTPPAEDATDSQLFRLEASVQAEFDAGEGIMVITKDTGVFVCKSPRQ